MSEAQLERSVLESKEREELFAIADALGTRPTSRAKKSDLVTAILRATGVEDAGASPEPARRTRTRRAPAAAAPSEEAANDPGPADSPGAGERAHEAEATDAATAAGEGVAGGVLEGAAGVQLELDDQPSSNGHGPAASDGSDTTTSTSPASGSGAEQRPLPADALSPTQPVTTAQERFEAEGGGRRNRRRRGRDRGTDRAERELQGAPAEVQYSGEPIPVAGLLDLRDEGYGFLRTGGYLAGAEDVYVSISQVRRFALRRGDHVEGAARPAGNNEKYPALLRVDTVSGLSAEDARSRSRFDELTAVHPTARLSLEPTAGMIGEAARIVDLLAPIGKGQRGLIASPPGAGATSVLASLAAAVIAGSPDAEVMIVLVDERPEDVTEVRRLLGVDVVSSSFDRPGEEHVQVAELAVERAKRLVEQGHDVVVVLDGITRLARAYNMANPGGGRIVSGGIDPVAVHSAKRFFGAARNTEEAGSLTMLAVVLVETGSGVDEVIFEELESAATMLVRLDRALADRRLYPAVDVARTSTRHEELLYDEAELHQVTAFRRTSADLADGEGGSAASLGHLLDRLHATRTRSEFLAELATPPAPSA